MHQKYFACPCTEIVSSMYTNINNFIPCFSSNLGYIGQTRRWLKTGLDELRRKAKNEEI